MKAVIQRVSSASVTVDDIIIDEIKSGLVILVGIEDADDDEDIDWLSNKVINLRIFNDAENIPNLSLLDTDGDILLISQFTLQAAVKKGNRPSYIKAASPDKAIPVYQKFIATLERTLNKKIFTGKFGADMKVALVNDGPHTIFIDTKNKV